MFFFQFHKFRLTVKFSQVNFLLHKIKLGQVMRRIFSIFNSLVLNFAEEYIEK